MSDTYKAIVNLDMGVGKAVYDAVQETVDEPVRVETLDLLQSMPRARWDRAQTSESP